MAQPLRASPLAVSSIDDHDVEVVYTDSAAYQAFRILQVGFVAAPVIAGIDKFTDRLVNWDMYLAPLVPQILHVSAHTFMIIVGVVEVIAGLLVAVMPKVGGYVVGFWLLGIVANLFINPAHFWDIALRDFGLSLGAFALARLASHFDVVRKEV